MDTKRQLRALEAGALVATALTVLVTYLLLGITAVERNPVSAALLSATNWYVVALWNLGLTAAVFALLRRLRHIAPDRAVLGSATVLLAICAGNAGNDLRVFASVGVPDSLPPGFWEFAAVVATATVALAARTELHALAGSLRETRLASRQSARAVALTALLVLSVPAMVYAPVVQHDHDGTALALTEDRILDDFEDGDKTEWTVSNNDDWDVTSGQTLDGQYSLRYADDGSSAASEMSLSLSKSNPENIEFDIYYDEFPAGETDEFTFSDVSTVIIDGSGNVKDGGGNHATTIKNKTWYTIKLGNIDWQEETYTLEVLNANGGSVGSTQSQFNYGNDNYFDAINIWSSSYGSGMYHIEEFRANVDLGPKVSGTVTTPGDTVISNANVTIDGQTVQTDSNGYYETYLDSTGTYEVTASSPIDSTTHTVSVPSSGKTVDLTIADGDIGGQVVACPITAPDCDNATGVANATVIVAGVNHTAVEQQFDGVSSASEAEAKAEDIREEIENAKPDNWDSKLPSQSELLSDFNSADGDYVAMHYADDWSAAEGEYARGRFWSGGESSLDTPRVQADEGQRVVFSIWDPSKTGGVFTSQNPIDESLPGATTSGTITFERLGAGGDVIERHEMDTTDFFHTEETVAGSKTHQAVAGQWPPGYYRVSAGGSQVYTYVKIGSGTVDIFPGYADDIEQKADQAQQLTNLSQQIADYKSQGVLEEQRVQTDENGKWSMTIAQSNVETVGIQAFKAGGTIDRTADRSIINQIRDARAVGDHEGAVYVPREPVHADVPNDAVTVQTLRIGREPFADMDSLGEDALSQFQKFLNANMSDLEKAWDIPARVADEVNETDRYEQRREQFRNMAEDSGMQDIVDQMNEDPQIDLTVDGQNLTLPEANNQSTAELEQRLQELEFAIEELGEPPEDPPDVGVSNDVLSGTYPFAGTVDEETVDVSVKYADGTVETVPEEYWSVNSGAFGLGADEVVVEDYPVDSDRPNPTLTVDAVVDEELVQSSGSAVNPGYSGDVPQITALDVNTLSPGSDSKVVVEPRAEDGTGFDKVVSATGFAPDGTEFTPEVRNLTKAQFTTKGEGRHTVRITYQNAEGDNFIERVTVDADDGTGGIPPTLVLDEQGPPVAADSLTNAEVIRENGHADVTAVIPANGDLSNLHIRGDAILAEETDITVVEGDSRETVRQHISTVIHENVSDETLLWRNSAALTQASGPNGEVTDGRIRSYTNADGQLTLTALDDPSATDRISHWIDARTAGLPLIGAGAPLLAGVIVVIRRRRHL